MIKPEDVPTRVFVSTAEELEVVSFFAYAQQLGELSLQAEVFESDDIETAVKTIFDRDIVAIDTFENFAESIGFTNSRQVWNALLKYARPRQPDQEFSKFEASLYDHRRQQRRLHLQAEHGLPNKYGRILPSQLDLSRCFVDFNTASGTKPFLDVDRFRALLQRHKNPDKELATVPNVSTKSVEFINLLMFQGYPQ